MSDQVHKAPAAKARPTEPPALTLADSNLKPYLTRDEVMAMPKADPGLRAELKAMGSEETDTVGPFEW